MRSDKRLSIDEIAERMSISRSTIYHWVRDIEIAQEEFDARGRGSFAPAAIEARRRGTERMQRTYAARRLEAYELGRSEFAELSKDPQFAQFLCLYIAEGSKRCRNRVALCNSDIQVVVLAAEWIGRYARNPLDYRIQYHADQDLDDLRAIWSAALGVEPATIRLQRKSNSNQMKGRNWRSVNGVLTVTASDTQLRARLQGWIDELRLTWPKIESNGA